MGVDEVTIEARLDTWFSLAEVWKAVLLIDEADVFLEKRSKNDIRRNALVAVFLRKREYFRGLLFLTTHRTGQIDDAFLSRVHIGIRYFHLDKDKRNQIWQGFFEKLEIETQGAVYIDANARTYLMSDEKVQALEWNGRQIRNAFQTAIALAEYQAYQNGRGGRDLTVTRDHFEHAVTMSRDFLDYINKTDAEEKNEKDRAYAQGDRNDRAPVLR